jgi:hypothetical protein
MVPLFVSSKASTVDARLAIVAPLMPEGQPFNLAILAANFAVEDLPVGKALEQGSWHAAPQPRGRRRDAARDRT